MKTTVDLDDHLMIEAKKLAAENRTRPSTPAQARRFVESLIRTAGGLIWLPSANFDNRLLKMAETMKASGPRIFDLQIAMAVFENGAREIWTHDRNFLSVPGLRVVDPL